LSRTRFANASKINDDRPGVNTTSNASPELSRLLISIDLFSLEFIAHPTLTTIFTPKNLLPAMPPKRKVLADMDTNKDTVAPPAKKAAKAASTTKKPAQPKAPKAPKFKYSNADTVWAYVSLNIW
jgi:hypothetical protein